MKKTSVAYLLAGVLLASLIMSQSISAEAVRERHVMIAIDDGTENGQVFIDLDDSESAMDLNDMQLGETRSLIDKNGRSVLVTRSADGFQLDVDGKRIEIPAADSYAGHVGQWTSGDHRTDVHVDVTRDIRIERVGEADDVMIISGNPIDDITKDGIRSLLSSSGHGGDVVFLDDQGNGHPDRISDVHEAHQIKVISKEINATN